MREVGVLEAKTGFSGLVAEIERTGEEVVVTRHGRPIVRISAVAEQRLSRAERAALVRQLLAERSQQPSTESFDVRDALGRDRGDEWS